MNRSDLLTILSHVKPSLTHKEFIPILSHYCFKDGEVFGFNDLIAIKTACPLNIEGAVKGSILQGLLDYSDGEDVEITQKKNKILIECGKGSSALPILPKKEFIFEFPEFDEDFSLVFGKEHLEAISVCLSTVSSDTSHPERMGVTVRLRDIPVFYSTDGKTITCVEIEVPVSDEPIDEDIILPLEFCQVLSDMSSEYEEQELRFNVKDGYVIASFGKDYMLFSRLVRGISPMDFEKVIAANLEGVDNDHFIEVPEALPRALSRSSFLIDPSERGRCELMIEDRTLKVLGSSEFGESLEEIPLDTDHPDIKIECYAGLLAKSLEQAESFALKERCTIIFGELHLAIVANLKPSVTK